MKRYTTRARYAEATHVVKGSTFIARVYRLDSAAEVSSRLEMQRANERDASHHCYAYRHGQEYRFFDDGEPAGTAGRPILEVLERRGLDRVLVVVTRYFGGTKLGAGGLARAYRSAAAQACDKAGRAEVQSWQRIDLEVPFEAMDAVHRVLDAFPKTQRGAPSFTAAGMRLSVRCVASEADDLERQLVDASRGSATVSRE